MMSASRVSPRTGLVSSHTFSTPGSGGRPREEPSSRAALGGLRPQYKPAVRKKERRSAVVSRPTKQRSFQ